ncbi:unnamed protein product, partial [Symbiodinium sp. KB8]
LNPDLNHSQSHAHSHNDSQNPICGHNDCQKRSWRQELRSEAAKKEKEFWKLRSKSRFNLIRQRAAKQHVDYLRQLDPPRPQRTAEIEPQLRSKVGDLRTTFNHPEIMHQPTEM